METRTVAFIVLVLLCLILIGKSNHGEQVSASGQVDPLADHHPHPIEQVDSDGHESDGGVSMEEGIASPVQERVNSDVQELEGGVRMEEGIEPPGLEGNIPSKPSSSSSPSLPSSLVEMEKEEMERVEIGIEEVLGVGLGEEGELAEGSREGPIEASVYETEEENGEEKEENRGHQHEEEEEEREHEEEEEKEEERHEHEEEDTDEDEEVEQSSLAEIMKVIGAQAEEEQRALEEANRDEELARLAELKAAREEAAKQQAEKEKDKAQAKENTTAGGPAPPKPRTGGLGGGSPMHGLGGFGGRGIGRSYRGGRVPPTDQRAQSEMMSAAFGGGGGEGGGSMSFEVMMQQQEGMMMDGRRGAGPVGEETVRARLAAKLVLETDALLHGIKGPGMIGTSSEDGEEGEEDEDGVQANKNQVAKEIGRIVKEGEKDDPNLYRILGVSVRVNQQKIKERFRALVLMVHPDKTTARDAKEAFQLVQEAYETLSSPGERRKYDAFLVKLRAKHWKQRMRPIRDKLDEWSDYTGPIVGAWQNKGRLALASFLIWALILP